MSVADSYKLRMRMMSAPLESPQMNRWMESRRPGPTILHRVSRVQIRSPGLRQERILKLMILYIYLQSLKGL